MEVSKGRINLFFNHAPNGFMVKGNGVSAEFLIRGNDQNFYPLK